MEEILNTLHGFCKHGDIEDIAFNDFRAIRQPSRSTLCLHRLDVVLRTRRKIVQDAHLVSTA